MKFRPADDPRNAAVEGDPNPGGPTEWEDNALSNLFAHASYKLVPTWCQTPEHFTSKLTQYLFTDCPCCLFWRGIVVGAVIGGAICGVLGIVIGVVAAAP